MACADADGLTARQPGAVPRTWLSASIAAPPSKAALTTHVPVPFDTACSSLRPGTAKPNTAAGPCAAYEEG